MLSGRLFRISVMSLIDVTMVSLLLSAAVPSILKAHEPFSDAVLFLLAVIATNMIDIFFIVLIQIWTLSR